MKLTRLFLKIRSENPLKFSVAITVAVITYLIFGYLLVWFNYLVALAFLVSIGLSIMFLSKPDIATLSVIFILYSNLAAVAHQFHGVPKIFAASVTLLLGLPLLIFIFIKREKIILDHVFLLMIIFFVVQLTSACFSRDFEVAKDNIISFIFEGLILYFLTINVVRRYTTLKKIIWTLILAGSFMGGLSIFQEVTNTQSNNYGGLAQVGGVFTVERGVVSGKTTRGRSAGPIGEKNRYGQIMLMLIPLALFRLLEEKSNRLKFAALSGLLLIFGGFLLTFSRGAFVTLLLIIVILLLLKTIKIRFVLTISVLFLLIIGFVVPEYVTRMQSLIGIEGLLVQGGAKPDHVIRSRTAENIAALNVFLDHPIWGVGPGQYNEFYSLEYVNRVGIVRQDKGYRAHSLYLELLAETGLVGFCSFMAIIFLIMYQLWRTRVRFLKTHRDLANVATVFFLSLIGYLGTGVFLHLSYQRYFWIFAALASAAKYCIVIEVERRDNILTEHES